MYTKRKENKFDGFNANVTLSWYFLTVYINSTRGAVLYPQACISGFFYIAITLA